MEGLFEGIELALETRFGIGGLTLTDSIRAIGNIEDIESLKGLIRKGESLDRLREFLSGLSK